MAVKDVKDKQEISDDIQWNAENEVHLFSAITGHKPVGVNKHFHMACIVEKLRQSLHKDISPQVVWDHLHTMYDMQALDESENLPFPNEEQDFSLPDTLDFVNLMNDKGELSSSEDEILKDSSKKDQKEASRKDTKEPPKKETPKKEVAKETPVKKEVVKDTPKRDLKDTVKKEVKDIPRKEIKEFPRREPAARRESHDSEGGSKETKTAKPKEGSARREVARKEPSKEAKPTGKRESRELKELKTESLESPRDHRRETRKDLKSTPTPKPKLKEAEDSPARRGRAGSEERRGVKRSTRGSVASDTTGSKSGSPVTSSAGSRSGTPQPSAAKRRRN